MKILFLRGNLPLDFRPDRLEYDTIDECEDMWTVLMERVSRSTERTELWYYGAGKNIKKRKPTSKFIERWMNLDDPPDFNPDIVIARGGFSEYNRFVGGRFPKSKKVYYGAGLRYRPTGGKWDQILVDSVLQQSRVPGSFLFVKPAADNLFKPIEIEKKYDICFMANATQAEIKQHEFAFKAFANSGVSILHLGLCDDRLKRWAKDTDVTFGGWHRRKRLPELISQCRVGLVCSTSYDSCPRVLPEYMACNLPVIALREMNFWHDKYVNSSTGILCDDRSEVLAAANILLKANLNVRGYYDECLSLDRAAVHLLGLLK